MVHPRFEPAKRSYMQFTVDKSPPCQARRSLINKVCVNNKKRLQADLQNECNWLAISKTAEAVQLVQIYLQNISESCDICLHCLVDLARC